MNDQTLLRIVDLSNLDDQIKEHENKRFQRKKEAIAAIKAKTATFEDLVIVEPSLNWLAQDALHYREKMKRKRVVCANARWYGYGEWVDMGLKERLCQVVGWEGSNPLLRSVNAYDLAYKHIYKLLPYCRNCGEARP